MHGIVFCELRRFVEEGFGHEAWGRLLAATGTPGRLHLPVTSYPDAELVALVSAASRQTGLPAPALLERFGEALVPAYLKLYGHLVRPEWRALDLVEHTEETIHKVVRVQQPGAAPPELRCDRIRADEVWIHYTSPRRLCSVARGILRGVAAHYGERFEIEERQCMLKGAQECLISVVST